MEGCDGVLERGGIGYFGGCDRVLERAGIGIGGLRQGIGESWNRYLGGCDRVLEGTGIGDWGGWDKALREVR